MRLDPERVGSAKPTIKLMKLRYAGTCSCGTPVAAGVHAGWDTTGRRVVCCACLAGPASAAPQPVAEPPAPPLHTTPISSTGAAGASLQREYERRSAKREDRIRSEHPRLGKIILALTDEPPSTRAFKVGADGERRATAKIAELCGPDVHLLCNRKLGRGRRDGDIDLISIGPAGVYVVDVKHYADQKVEVRRSGGLFSPIREQLVIDGRDKTKLLGRTATEAQGSQFCLRVRQPAAASQKPASRCTSSWDLPKC